MAKAVMGYDRKYQLHFPGPPYPADDPLASVGAKVQFLGRIRNGEYPPHTHGFIEMVFVAEGSWWHEIEGRAFEHGPGRLGIVHQGLHHQFRTDDVGAVTTNIYCDPLQPLPDLPRPLDRLLPDLLPLHDAARKPRNEVLLLRLAEPGEVQDLLRRWEREQKRRAPGWTAACHSYWRLFLIHCTRALLTGDEVHQERFDQRSARIEALRRDLDRHSERAWKVEDLARRVGMRTGSLCRAFKRLTGRTIQDYLCLRRVQAAMRMLRHTDRAIGEIGASCGYAERSTFSRTFQRVAGCSPGAYRRRVS